MKMGCQRHWLFWKIMGEFFLYCDIQGAHKAATDLYILHPVPQWILEDTCRNSMNQLCFDNDFHILPSRFCTHRNLRRKNKCRFIHTVQPCVNYGKIESYTSLLAKGQNDEMSVRLSVIGWWTDGGMSLAAKWWSNKWENRCGAAVARLVIRNSKYVIIHWPQGFLGIIYNIGWRKFARLLVLKFTSNQQKYWIMYFP